MFFIDQKTVENGTWFPLSAVINKLYMSINCHCHPQDLSKE